MSDTPETDAELAEMFFGFYTMGGLPADAVKVEFARKLERERDVAREVTKNLSVALTAAIRSANARQDETEHAMAERDEAVRSCHIWQQGHSKIVEDRDYWRAEAERWRALRQENDDEVVIDDQTAPYGEWWEVSK